ncbi:gamma-glutamyl-gamma-aminobutyrate hydrolase family protein [Tannerella forsythia]|uniref:Gamma-glutamyl-gamma-aminobutyrate hydrolase family protein n=1 Tax=Tannerella forsythia TaxID=28112 RepID=A0A3P1XVL0_TANFO|nr:gamma-glutamyl-gamma-aminobutyrate hydrolase family protein [Tannerella forsythia]RRD62555.1 gamma-glutamyl-gamma-aminobutyrate hydrolase family protein [Tannerella forsythia]
MSVLLDTLYKNIESSASTLPSHRKPKIGISANRKEGTSCIAEPYFQSVVMAGGAPVLIPVITDIHTLTSIVEDIDGLIFSGGGDIHPEYLGEAPIPKLGDTDSCRDEYDFLLLKLAFDRQVPVFGICRGHQLINVAFGGTLYQDIHAQHPKEALQHSQEEARDIATHTVVLAPFLSKLQTALHFSGFPQASSDRLSPIIAVNSIHHQAVKDVASEFIATATAPDGVNEAMEHPEYPIFSVQWHPEPMAVSGNETMLNLFRYHLHQAEVYAQAKALHRKIITIDSHTDTPMIFQTFDLGRKEGGKVNLPLMREGHLDAAFMVAYIPQGDRDAASLQKATDYATDRLTQVITQAGRYPHEMGIAQSSDELRRLKEEGKKAILLGIENGYALGKDLTNLRRFRQMGVSYITLCHNGDNDLCDSAAGQAEWGGLSPFGKEVVAEMNRLGMMIDVSHAADRTFYDVLKHSTRPIIASHSSCRALCNHRRNLDDNQIKALAQQGGVIQICLYKGFINESPEKASLSDAIRHILHVIDLVGIDYVGIGSDFDGDGELIGCRAANELMQITMRLIAEGLDDESIAKIWGGNLMRVMNKVQNGIK